MFQGLVVFGIGGIVLVAAYLGILRRRQRYEETVAPEDRLSDEDFRRIEFGDDGP